MAAGVIILIILATGQFVGILYVLETNITWGGGDCFSVT